jgi:hypothetical protein
VARDVTAHCDMREHRMLTLGQAARIGTVPATGPAIRHATPDATDAELRYWASRAEEGLTELRHNVMVAMAAFDGVIGAAVCAGLHGRLQVSQKLPSCCSVSLSVFRLRLK